METERTLVLLKPDAILRGICGKIINRFEETGLKIIAMKLIEPTVSLIEKHYDVHKGKDFYDNLVKYMSNKPVVAMILEGRSAIEATRKLCGDTDPLKAAPGTIRGDLALKKTDVLCNLVHASDSEESSQKEISLFFKESELIKYERIDQNL